MGCSSSSARGGEASAALREELAREQEKLQQALKSRRESSALRQQQIQGGDEWYDLYRDTADVLEGLVMAVERQGREDAMADEALVTVLENELLSGIQFVVHEAVKQDQLNSMVNDVLFDMVDNACDRVEVDDCLQSLLTSVDEHNHVREEVTETLNFVSALVERVFLAQQLKEESDSNLRDETATARIKQGWLLKQGHLVKNWKRRWFVLDKGILRYYVKPLNVPPFGSKLRGEIHLEGYSVVNSPISPSHFELFSLSEELSKRLDKEESSRSTFSLGGVYSRSRASLTTRTKKTASTLIDAMDIDNATAWMTALRKQQQFFFRLDSVFSEVEDYNTVFAEGPLGRKGGVMTQWVDRWFVLKINKIEYFEDHTLNVKKGEFPIHPYESEVIHRDGIHRLRFCVTNGEDDRLELCAQTEEERQNWVTMIMRVSSRDFGKDYSQLYDEICSGKVDDEGDTESCMDYDEVAAAVMFDDDEQQVKQLREMIHREVSALGFSDSDSEASLSESDDEPDSEQKLDTEMKESDILQKSVIEISESSQTEHKVESSSSTLIIDNKANKSKRDDRHGSIDVAPVDSCGRDNESDDKMVPINKIGSNRSVTNRSASSTTITSIPDDVDLQRETIALLRKQLQDKGEVPLEFIPLEKLRMEIADLVQQASQGVAYDEARLDFCLKCLENNPQHQAEQEAKRQQWVSEITPFAMECLEIQRSYTPSHIFHSSVTSLVDDDDIRTVLAKRFLMKKCLWLVRVSKQDLSKMHIVELSGRFNPEAQGLDIVESAAIYMSLPEKFLNDNDGKKERWKNNVENHFKNLYQKKMNNSLTPNAIRHPAYKTQEPYFANDTQFHKFGEVLKNSDQQSDEFILKSKAKNIGRRSSIATTDKKSIAQDSSSQNEVFLARRTKNVKDLSLPRQEFGKELDAKLRRNSVASPSASHIGNVPKPSSPSFLNDLKQRRGVTSEQSTNEGLAAKSNSPNPLLQAIQQRKINNDQVNKNEAT